MKRFLLSGLLLLAMGRTAFGYLNTGTVQVPPMDPQLVAIDDVNFVNKGMFNLDLTLEQNIYGTPILYTTTDTLNYMNTGTMISTPGFDFEYFPLNPPPPQPGVPFNNMAANFVNANNGSSAGVIAVTNFGGQFFTIADGQTFVGGLLGALSPAELRVNSTNIVNSGLITMNDSGLIDLTGGDLDLRRGRLVMTGGNTFSNSTAFGITYLDYGSDTTGTNSFGWDPFFDLTANTALSPIFFQTAEFFDAQMFLTNATPYFQVNAVGTNLIVWRITYLQDSSPPNVTKNVYFDPGTDIGTGQFHVEWAGGYRDAVTGQPATNYFYLSDDPARRRNTNFFLPFPFIPEDFTFAESQVKLIIAAPATPGYVNPAPPGIVTNDYSYVSVKPDAVLEDTNSIIGGSPTNLPGRIELTASHSLNLADSRIIGPNYLRLNSSTEFLGNSNAAIYAPYADLNLGVTNGSLTLTNLLIPQLPVWTGVPGAPSAVTAFTRNSFLPVIVPMGGIQAWSGSFIFVDVNGVTNDVRVLLVNSALEPTTPALQQDVILHATNDLTISDDLNIFRTFSSDATILTITTNDNSAFSLSGAINLLSPDIFWSSSLPNLQYLTNWGLITSTNLANFAGNMLNPYSDPAAATPYQAFVNHGTIIDEGILVRANYFENSGLIEEGLANGIDIGVSGAAIATNGSFIAPQGGISLAANSLFLSNGVINAGQTLTLTTPCSLSDGYVFGNQFGHITNSVLPNVVTNGNIWSVGGGVQITVKPPTADLLGTTITNISLNGEDSINTWPGDDRGCSPGGYATNLALGRMIFYADASPSRFTFETVTGSNALYVDSIEFQGSVTNTDAAGNFPSINIQPGMKIYYAQAMEGGVSIAEKLNGKNGGGFCWVSNYAGVYSSTNIPYPDGNTYIFNEALAISPDIDSDGDGTVNRDDQTPIPIGSVYDINNIGPQPCGGDGGGGTGTGGNGGTGSNGGGANKPGTLSFPVLPSGTATIWFSLAQGSYYGLFYDTNGVNPASSGFFTAKVTSKGGLSAKLQLGAHTYSFSKPPFDSSGHFSGTVGTGSAALKVDLQVVNNDEIVGQVSGNGWTAQLLAEKAVFSSNTKAPWAGKDTLLLASNDTNSTAAAGDSFGSVTISASGAVQWSGTLPDGTKVTQKSAVSKDGVWPLYCAPYNGAGVLIGWMQCTNNPDVTGSGVWIVPAGSNGLYPHGLTNELDATGSSTSSGSLGTYSSLDAIISGSPLLSSLTNSVTISGKTSQSADGTLKLSVNLKTGLFSGSVTDPATSQVLSLQGAVLEGSGTGGGFFLNANKTQGGKVSLAPEN